MMDVISVQDIPGNQGVESNVFTSKLFDTLVAIVYTCFTSAVKL